MGKHLFDLEDFAAIDESLALPSVKINELLVLPIPGGHPISRGGDICLIPRIVNSCEAVLHAFAKCSLI